MTRSSRRFAAVAVAGLLAAGLSGCGSSDPRPDLGTPSPQASADSKGSYKVGRPYEVAGVWYTPAVDYAYDETGIASWYGPGFHGRQTANGERYDQYDLTAAHPTLPMPTLVRVTNLENGRQVDLRVNDRGPFKRGRILDVSRRGAELLGFLSQGTAKVRVRVLERESRQLAALAQNGQLASSELIAKGPGGRVLPPGPVDQGPTAPVGTVAAEALPPPSAPAVRTAARPGAVTAPRPSGTVTQVAVRPSNLFVQAGAFSEQGNALRLAERLSPYGPPQVTQTEVEGRRFWRVRLGPLNDVAQADSVLAALIDGGFPQSRVVVE